MTSIKDFIEYYYEADESFFISSIHHKPTKCKNFINTRESLEKRYELLNYYNQEDSLYFTYNSFKSDSKSKSIVNVLNIKALLFDFDEPDTSKADLEKLLQYLPEPSYILETSKNKFQVCYKLVNAITDSEKFEEFKIIHKVLTKFFNSDKNVCSIEKLFRLPFTTNRKNDFKCEIVLFNKNNKLNINIINKLLNDIINKNNDIKLFYNELINNEKISKKSNKKLVKKSSNNITKNIVNNGFIKLEKIEDKNELRKCISLYKNLLKNNNNNDASECDIIFIKNRAKNCNDFNIIFNEILNVRNILNKPLRREISSYYKDRFENIFSKC
jgi:hypothetical protein